MAEEKTAKKREKRLKKKQKSKQKKLKSGLYSTVFNDNKMVSIFQLIDDSEGKVEFNEESNDNNDDNSNDDKSKPEVMWQELIS